MGKPERGSRHNKEPRGGQPRQRRHQKAKVDKSVARRRNHDQDGRVKEALERAERDRLALEARIAREQAEPAIGPAAGALYVQMAKSVPELEPAAPAETDLAEPPEEPEELLPRLPARVPPEQRGNQVGSAWTRAAARSMLRQRYRLEHVIRLTGWGRSHLEDLPLDAEGYGLSIEDWREREEATWSGGLAD